MSDDTLDTLQFFKALADSDRLQIVGLLARHNRSNAQLAEAIDAKPAALARHLARLTETGLVSAANGQYRLRLDRIHALAARVATHPVAALPDNTTEYDRGVLAAYLTPEGRLKEIPLQEKKRLALLRYVAQSFKPERRYTEKQVNETLSRFHEDPASLRRYLIDSRLLSRTSTGSEYWRAEDNVSRDE